MDEDKPLELPKLTPGRHLVQAFQVWLYHIEPSGLKTEVARGLQAEIEFEFTGGHHLAIDFRFNDDTLAIRIEEMPDLPASLSGRQESAIQGPKFFHGVWDNLQRLRDLCLGIESAEREPQASTSTIVRVAHRL